MIWSVWSPASTQTSRISRRFISTPSSTAREMCPTLCICERPTRLALASGATYGERSPSRYGRNSTPPAPGSTPLASEISRSKVTCCESLSGVSASRSHWNAPPALSETPMMCQRPGSLPAPTCTRPSGLSGQRDSPPATIPAVPIVKPAEPSSISPIAVVWMTASPPPPNTGVPAGRPHAAHRSSRERAGLLDRLDHVGQQRRVDVDLAEQLGRPGAVLDVEEPGAGRVGDLGRVDAGHPVAGCSPSG